MVAFLVFLDLVLGIILLVVFRAEIDALRRRMTDLERRYDRVAPEPRPYPKPSPRPPASTVFDEPAPEPRPSVPMPAATPAVPSAPAPAAPEPPMPPPVPPPSAPRPAAAPVRLRTPEPEPASAGEFSVEEIIGSVWTQNVGSVLLLLGVFFLILWGYSTGRFGPGVLVAAGVAMGGVFFWRGHHVAKTLPMLGHAFIGIGLGIAYLALYLGHFALGVLAPAPAFVLIAAVSVAGILAGMHYRVQAIAGLATIGAFVPQTASILTGVPGFAENPGTLLLYLLVVDGIVLELGRRSGWSSLAFSALLATVLTWTFSLVGRSWGWPVQIGLTALTLGFGLVALPRLARAKTTPPPAELAVVALAPYAFVICSWTFLQRTPAAEVAILLGVLAILSGVVSLRLADAGADPALYRATVTPAVGFLAAALERALGPTLTPMVWTVTGVVLVAVASVPGGGWLRGLGTILAALGTLGTVSDFVMARAAPPLGPGFPLGFLTAAALRQFVVIVALFVGGHVQRRGAIEDEDVADLWHFVGTLFLAAWLARMAADVGFALVPPQSVATGGGVASGPTAQNWPPSLVLVSAAWLLQATVLLTRARPGRAVVRAAAYVVALLALVALFFSFFIEAISGVRWVHPGTPWASPAVLFQVAFLAWTALLVRRLGHPESDLDPGERTGLQLSMLTFQALVLGWITLEARRLADFWPEVDRGRMAAVLASAGWLAQAVIMFGIGWARGFAFLRWLGLGLFGLTVLKVTLFDLSTIDPFWRFLVAIATGAVLLSVSFLYQRSRRRRPG